MFKKRRNNAKRKDFSGEILTIPKSKDGYVRNGKIYGKSVQDGEPTPDNPVEIKTVPSELDITSCGRNLWDAETTFAKLKEVHSAGFTYETKDGRRCVKVVAPNATTRNMKFRYGFKENTRYSFRYDFFNISPDPSLPGVHWNVYYTDGAFSSMRSLTHDQWSIRTVTSDANKTVDYVHIIYSTGSNYTYFDLDSFSIQESVDDIPYTPYQGGTTTITLRDTEGKLHTLKSLPDGTRDEVDLDGGESVERCFLATIKDGTGWSTNQEQTSTISVYTLRKSLGTTRGTLPLPMLSTWGAVIDYSIAQSRDQECVWFAQYSVGVKILKSRLSSPDLLGAQKYLKDKFEAGEGLEFLLPLANPTPWTLHPDEQKKIQTVDSEKGYIYTTAEVQPELSVNAISYGED